MPERPAANPPGLNSTAQERVTVLAAPPGFECAVVCAIWRSLPAGLADVAATVPANVYACLNVVGEGEVRVDGRPSSPFPPIFVCGPMTKPLKTCATAPLRSLSVVLQPWLLTSWFGLDPRTLVDSWVAGDDVASLRDGAIAQALIDAIGTSNGLASALELLALRGAPADDDWAALADALMATSSVAAAAARAGAGVRHFERRFSRRFGMSPKRWLKMKRFEASLVQMAQHGGPLAGVAAEAGYADQAHMTREYGDVAGHTPGQTRSALASGAVGYWAFRPAADAAVIASDTGGSSSRVGFVQDPPDVHR